MTNLKTYWIPIAFLVVGIIAAIVYVWPDKSSATLYAQKFNPLGLINVIAGQREDGSPVIAQVQGCYTAYNNVGTSTQMVGLICGDGVKIKLTN